MKEAGQSNLEITMYDLHYVGAARLKSTKSMISYIHGRRAWPGEEIGITYQPMIYKDQPEHLNLVYTIPLARFFQNISYYLDNNIHNTNISVNY